MKAFPRICGATAIGLALLAVVSFAVALWDDAYIVNNPNNVVVEAKPDPIGSDQSPGRDQSRAAALVDAQPEDIDATHRHSTRYWRIFERLEMTDSSWRDDWTRVVKRRAMGYTERDGQLHIDLPFENVYGNGGLLTTVSDLLKWNANFENLIVGDASFVDELQRPAVFNDGRTHEYALGLYVDTYKGIREVDHSGGGLGFVSHLVRYPEQRVSVAVLCNAGYANATMLARAVADLFLTGQRAAPPPLATHTLTSEEAARLVGLYRSRQPAMVATVAYDDKGLRIEYQYGGRLVPMSATRFATSDGRTYEFDARGGMRAIDEFGTVVSYDRVEPAKPSIEQLKEFTGSYVSDEAETTFRVQLDGASLSLQRRPDPPTRLKPVYADAFTLGNVWVTFRRDASGAVVGFSMSGERMWNLPFRRHAKS